MCEFKLRRSLAKLEAGKNVQNRDLQSCLGADLQSDGRALALVSRRQCSSGRHILGAR
jgi:hypothetical protein